MARSPRLLVLGAALCLLLVCNAASGNTTSNGSDEAKDRATRRAERLRARRRQRLDPNFANMTTSLFEWQAKYVHGSGNSTGQVANATRPAGGWMSWMAMGSDVWQSTTTLVDGECELLKVRPPKKEYLVLVAVGDTATPVSWLNQAKWANFDVIAVYFGDNGYFECPDCRKVFHGKAQKYRLFYSLHQLPEWKDLTAGYKAIMTADDDLVMSTCDINRAFETFDRYGLWLAQMSLCDTKGSWSWWRMMYQQREHVLRYVTFVEIMAPIFTTRDGFYDEFVVPTFYDSYSGWGLDFVWPFLLKYPTDRIAVLDEVCMVHPEKKKAGKSIYASGAPYDQRVEEARREAQFGYTRAAVRRLGYPFYPVQELGAVDVDAWQGSLERLDRAVRARLGPWFPVLLGLQALAGAACLLVLALRFVRRRRKGKDN